MEKIIFEKIENEDIFVSDYKNFIRNNEIDFSKEGISVVYGPNGTGKTSLVKALSSEKGTKVKYTYGGNGYTDGSQFFVINDQNNRNIIQGETKDFLLGDDIKKEFELQEYIENEYNRLCTESISILKGNYSVSSSSSKSIDCFSKWVNIQNIIKDLMNNRSKGSKTGVDTYISEFEKHSQITTPDYEKDKLDYIISDLSEKNPLIIEIETIDTDKLSNNSHIKEIEENTEAIKILSRFGYKDQCIVCDSDGIDSENLLSKKSKNKEDIIKTLDAKTKKIVEKIIDNVSEKDPFRIKDVMLGAIETGNLSDILLLKKSIKEYKNIFANKAIKELVQLYKASDIKIKNEEYQKMINQKPDITEEDFLYIEQIISNNMSKKLQIIRDDRKNIKIVLENKDFLGINREELPLSSGEQNFLSLTFEFLKAKNSDKPIIILDDPISSFDSIYKNKIAYAIVKILQNKKRIILTHNVDLLRLLDGQFKKCFRLFLFNNTENEENGFIALNSDERDMLINLDELLKTFREKIYEHIKDVELFLISLIPFMRGYSTIINDNIIKENLTQLMHGYKTGIVDIAECYIKLFGNMNNIIPNNYKVNVDDILSKTVDGKEIVNKDKYPLLNRTLVHSFTYLFLRLLIEKKLVSKYNIDTESKNGAKQLGQIISKAFPENSKNSDDIKNRVFLTTKKTLLNEFNHFEGNMSIFQPAIDITDHMLGKEKTDILAFINKL
ncbi:AAA family ATPase [uncultured Phascolarctobacterium sp.]|uniref:AAA family ATPase n=1 Tax=uncultured Phascolarctobacterium sp. TaxID=512296 RepID=UPI002594E055|nr:AAA family ATPase [uncultured Phascolarctobacterium sp.]